MFLRLKYIFLISLFLSLSSWAFVDEDLDGVDDSVDKCPNTPFDELVDKTGCPLKKEKYKSNFYLKVGGGILREKSKNLYFSAVSFAYTYKEFYFSVSPTYYLNYSSGLGDTYIYGSYSKFLDDLFLNFGLTVQLPTGNSNLSENSYNFTPSITFDIFNNNFDYFVYYGYTIKSNSGLKNRHNLSVGLGYQFNEKFYLNSSIDIIYSNNKTKNYLSFFGIWDFSEKYFLSLNYDYGLNSRAIDHSVFIKLGIKF